MHLSILQNIARHEQNRVSRAVSIREGSGTVDRPPATGSPRRWASVAAGQPRSGDEEITMFTPPALIMARVGWQTPDREHAVVCVFGAGRQSYAGP